MREIILDTETTGLKPEEGHRIIEIGAVEVINRRITGKHFHAYINPGRLVDPGAFAVHGISNEFLADKPAFNVIVDEFMAFVEGSQLVIHNAPFDVGFIDHEFKRIAKQWVKISNHCTVLDTLPLARKKHPGQKNSLDALCKRYEVDNSERSLHGALLDAKILALVYLAMTGGQGNLFADVHAESRAQSEKIVAPKKAIIRTGAVPVLLANAEELAAHAACMEEVGK